MNNLSKFCCIRHAGAGRRFLFRAAAAAIVQALTGSSVFGVFFFLPFFSSRPVGPECLE